MRISIAIMAHPKRKKMAQALFEKLDEMDFVSCELVMDNCDYEWNTGVRALQAKAPNAHWHLVIQDDAIISDNFYQNVKRALEGVPEKTCVSFYFGSGSPFPEKTERQFKSASEKGISWIRTATLFWGVCFAVRADETEKIITFGAGSNRLLDNRIGLYYFNKSRPIYNLVPSIVDHRQGQSILEHGEGKIRKAYEFVKTDIVVNSRVLIF